MPEIASEISAEVSASAVRIDLLLPPLLAAQRSSWEQGVAAQALLECYQFFVREDIPKPQQEAHFLPYLYAFAHESLVRQASDGRLATLLNGNGASDSGAADPASNGEPIYFLLALSERLGHVFPPPASATNASLAEGVDGMLSYIVDACPRAPINGDNSDTEDQMKLFSHRTDAVQIWSDTVYMLPPFLVSAAIFHLDHPHPRYQSITLLHMGLQQILLAAQALQGHSGEWSHIYDLSAKEYNRPAPWGVGNGWVCCGIVRVLRMLNCRVSEEDADPMSSRALATLLLHHPQLIDKLRRCLNVLATTMCACLKRIRLDGLFHDILDNESTFVETNLSQQLSYTLVRLLDLRLHHRDFIAPMLSSEILEETWRQWERVAETMRTAAVGKTDAWGFVRDVCGSPSFDKPGTAAEGQAWGIMMETARAEYFVRRRHFEAICSN
ncbi:uncharacterized protein FIBRA_05979 [Fibroporia radiculosa]|uniref:Uncharacterized protein n=1 Tax=Fibroporia radiculosa TaxID=599839 RepID=J4GRZ0_9APHY|nr:uncharacterized protein FIBRA_05979 [Fibroporia radiculosa]CCM03830.1 predicted protein [Fibroporia radiculosa]